MKIPAQAVREQRPKDLGGGVWSVPVPIPGNPLGYTLVYAIESPAGPRAGRRRAGTTRTPGRRSATAWRTLGIDVRDVRGVVVTHFHPDHAGLAGRVREESGRVDRHARGGRRAGRAHARLRPTARTATSRPTCCAGRAPGTVEVADGDGGAGRGRPRCPTAALRDGDLIDLPGRRLRAVWTRRATPPATSACTWRTPTGSSPATTCSPTSPRTSASIPTTATTLIRSVTSWSRWTEGRRVWASSNALPAHEWIFPDIAARAAEIRHHHEEKLERLGALLSERAEPLTIWETAAVMTWNRPWEDLPPVLRGMAAGRGRGPPAHPGGAWRDPPCPRSRSGALPGPRILDIRCLGRSKRGGHRRSDRARSSR